MARPHDPRRPGDDRERDERTGEVAAEKRAEHQEAWVDLQVRQAISRGDFADLPGLGKPIEGLTGDHDPDWWVRRLVEREQITGVLPPSLQIRREDAELDTRLDRLFTETEVRRAVAEFNERVRWALYRPPEGPPMITPPRDVEVEVERWRERLEARRLARLEAGREARGVREGETRARWWSRRRRPRP